MGKSRNPCKFSDSYDGFRGFTRNCESEPCPNGFWSAGISWFHVSIKILRAAMTRMGCCPRKVVGTFEDQSARMNIIYHEHWFWWENQGFRGLIASWFLEKLMMLRSRFVDWLIWPDIGHPIHVCVHFTIFAAHIWYVQFASISILPAISCLIPKTRHAQRAHCEPSACPGSKMWWPTAERCRSSLGGTAWHSFLTFSRSGFPQQWK